MTAVVQPPTAARHPTTDQPKWMTIAGWVLTGMVSALLTLSAVFKIAAPPFFREGTAPLGYPETVWVWIGLVELGCALIYLFPRTAVLGAILLTGYLGGATATHVRIDDPYWGPILGGVLVWLGIFLREPRLRALLPLRTSP